MTSLKLDLKPAKVEIIIQNNTIDHHIIHQYKTEKDAPVA